MKIANDKQKPKILVITGPTATGKTLLGVSVAKALNGEVVSADSMQVYKYMDIGTAKPTAEEMDNIPHHMIDVAQPWEDYSVARYVKEALPIVDDILNRNKLPVIVGGSGLYIDSLIRGRIFASRPSPELRQLLEAKFEKIGGAAMLSELKLFDEESADLLHENDKKRIVRAFEVFETTGIPLSQHNDEERKLPLRYKAIKFALTFADRAVLYNRINLRVDNMISAGLAEEVSSLLKRGVSQKCTSMQAIGYKEIAEFFSTGGQDLTLAVEKVKMESTRYAKRQLTWLRRNKDINWIIWDKTPCINIGVSRVQELAH